ncbi:hypothetical protein TRIUR3_10143 [Triticum urartu]|uniref:Uncharacterized protein n=2 Tax=Triticum TaxID=4564 RepID=A0A9R1NP13_TRITD|nr:hypothetical protein TRIUR3_10143 [Triticum urartu]VAH28424.1 unnamed protein product [Triticum turgidum subsp. durum]
MGSPAREMQEMDEFVLVPHAADLWSYQLDEDDDDHKARFLAGNDDKTIDVNHFASEPTPNAAVRCASVEPPAPSGSDSESEGSVDDDVESVGGLLEKASDADEDGEVTKVSARRDARLEQGMSVPRFEHAPAMISFGGSYGGHLF